MTDLYGANHTKAYQSSPSEKIGPGEFIGDVKVAYDSYTFDGNTTGSGDSIKLMKLPKNARVVGGFLFSITSLCDSGNANVGWEAYGDGAGVRVADADGFFDAIDVNATAHANLGDKAGEIGLFKKFDEEVQVVLTVDDDMDAADGEIIHLKIEYVQM